MKFQKARTAAIAVGVAAAIALSGTFAWQSISPMALNEAKEPTNPGGRLHDDFSGYEADDTKDVYVENFGNTPIFARVRLDEYMELGEGAGLKGTVDTPNPDNHATSLVATAKIDDVTTWTTHIPGDTGATTGAGKETGFVDPGKTFHTYWTWTMGGQAGDNPDGKTVYMPTFNKNKDSLKADINGTLAGLDGDPDAGEPYDDYHPYALSDPAATRVRDADTTTYPDGAAYDADDDTTDECGPYGGAGGSGVAGTNYEMVAESHKPQETMSASVITMAEYMDKTDAQKEEFLGWVYDVDGWAYWSQPIEPGTPTETDQYITNATGVLLDRIVLEHKPSESWYYGVNAVGQFITADDLGRSDDPPTGFYGEGEPPTDDALDLLDGIGVNTAAVKGAITPSASVTVDSAVKPLDYAVQGMSIDLAAAVAVTGEASPDQGVTWTVIGNSNATGTYIDDSTGTPVLHVAGDETGPLTLVARSTAYDRLKGKLKLPVHELKYTVTVTPDGGATSVLPGETLGFTAKLTSNDFRTGLPQTFTWVLDTTGGAYKTGTKIEKAPTDSSKATLTVAGNETAATIKLTATPTDTTTYPGLKGEATIAVPDVTYTVDIKDSAETPVSVKDTTVEVGVGGSATFTVSATSTPTGATITDNWTWTSSDTSKATVSGTGTTASVTVPAGVAVGQTATITATNSDYDPALAASFTVKAKGPTPADVAVGETVSVDGIEFIVLLKADDVNGKADGEETASNHSAALLLSKNTLGSMAHNPATSPYKPKWEDSNIRKYLNSEADSGYTDPTFDSGSTGWLYVHPTIKDKALTVNIQTRRAFDDPTSDGGFENKVFLLSEADVFNTSNHGADGDPQDWEYTYKTQIPYFNSDAKRKSGDSQLWWLRSPASSAGCVANVTAGGTRYFGSAEVTCGVRPAFWYNLDA